MTEKEAEKKTAIKNNKKLFVILAAVLLVILITATISIIAAYYQRHVVPNTWLAGMDVGNKTSEEVSDVLKKAYSSTTINLTDKEATDNSSIQTDFKSLGISIDIEKTVNSVFKAQRHGLFSKIKPSVRKEHSLVLVCDQPRMDEKLKTCFEEKIYEPKEPKVKYSKKKQKFKVIKGWNGQVADSDKLTKEIATDAFSVGAFTANIEFNSIPKMGSNKDAKSTVKKLNKMLRTQINVIYDGALIHTIDRRDIARWVSATCNDNKFEIAISESAIKTYLKEKLPGLVNRGSVERILLTGKDGNLRAVIQEGYPGRVLTGTSGLASKISGSLGEKKKINIRPVFQTGKVPVRKIVSDGEKWIEIDISSQTLILWSGNKKLKTFLISAGRAETPTVLGTYRVYVKRDDHTMKGENPDGTPYEVEHVRYICYFYSGYAIHAAPWHNNFGNPMSHGCINMRMYEAKIVYDFAPVGTRVVVHL